MAIFNSYVSLPEVCLCLQQTCWWLKDWLQLGCSLCCWRLAAQDNLRLSFNLWCKIGLPKNILNWTHIYWMTHFEKHSLFNESQWISVLVGHHQLLSPPTLIRILSILSQTTLHYLLQLSSYQFVQKWSLKQHQQRKDILLTLSLLLSYVLHF